MTKLGKDEEGDNINSTIQHVTVHSSLSPVSIGDIERRWKDDNIFHGFRKKIEDKLSPFSTDSVAVKLSQDDKASSFMGYCFSSSKIIKFS